MYYIFLFIAVVMTTEEPTTLPAYAPIVIGVGGGVLLLLFIAAIVCICFCCVLSLSKHQGNGKLCDYV